MGSIERAVVALGENTRAIIAALQAHARPRNVDERKEALR